MGVTEAQVVQLDLPCHVVVQRERGVGGVLGGSKMYGCDRRTGGAARERQRSESDSKRGMTRGKRRESRTLMPLSGMATAGLCWPGHPRRISPSSLSLNFFMAVRSPCTSTMLSGSTVRMKPLGGIRGGGEGVGG